MKPATVTRAVLAVLVALAAALAAAPAAAQDAGEQIPSIELYGELTPATADWIGHSLNEAADEGAPFAIVRLDTPGGLDSSTEEIVDHVRAAPMPVVVYVYPGGAEAGARGAAIVDAADVAAMAPGTTLESEGNDLGENRALKQGRIDMIAADQQTLLEKLDGYRVDGPKAETLSTAGAEVDDREMSFSFQVLEVLVDPNIAFLLLLIGLLGLALEAFAPGSIVPGAVGAFALILGVIGAVQLPLAAIGVVLLIVGMALLIAEASMPTAGVLGVLGVAALIAAGLVIFDTDSEQVAVAPALVVGAGATLGLATVFVGGKVLQARRRPVASGPEELLGAVATVRAPLDPDGQVFVGGALWEARVDPALAPVATGYRVNVEGIDGLVLVVIPLEDSAAEPVADVVGSEPEGTA